MPESNLNDSLNNLHNELAQPQPTEKAQAVADQLRAEIQPLIQQPDADHSIHYQSLGERLNLALVDLEVDHPGVAAAIKTVLDDLAAVGI